MSGSASSARSPSRGEGREAGARPRVGCMKPATMFIIVVLPQPDGPMIATNSPSAISYDTSSTTRSAPRDEGNSTDT